MGRYLVVCESEVIIQYPKAIKTGFVKYYPTCAAAERALIDFKKSNPFKNVGGLFLGIWDSKRKVWL